MNQSQSKKNNQIRLKPKAKTALKLYIILSGILIIVLLAGFVSLDIRLNHVDNQLNLLRTNNFDPIHSCGPGIHPDYIVC
jgi:hypothetical protein